MMALLNITLILINIGMIVWNVPFALSGDEPAIGGVIACSISGGFIAGIAFTEAVS